MYVVTLKFRYLKLHYYEDSPILVMIFGTQFKLLKRFQMPLWSWSKIIVVFEKTFNVMLFILRYLRLICVSKRKLLLFLPWSVCDTQCTVEHISTIARPILHVTALFQNSSNYYTMVCVAKQLHMLLVLSGIYNIEICNSFLPSPIELFSNWRMPTFWCRCPFAPRHLKQSVFVCFCFLRFGYWRDYLQTWDIACTNWSYRKVLPLLPCVGTDTSGNICVQHIVLPPLPCVGTDTSGNSLCATKPWLHIPIYIIPAMQFIKAEQIQNVLRWNGCKYSVLYSKIKFIHGSSSALLCAAVFMMIGSTVETLRSWWSHHHLCPSMTSPCSRRLHSKPATMHKQ